MTSWIDALHSLTSTTEAAEQYRDMRTRFAIAIAAQTVETARIAKVPAIYGVWLDAHTEPIYIGQTMNARRRLWDLPIGESHHLANTFPPEIWQRVVVVRWLDILARNEIREAELLADLQGFGETTNDRLRTIGLILEHQLQRAFQPKFNAKKRTRAGGWRPVNLARSRAVGATSTKSTDWLYAEVAAIWHALAADTLPHHTAVAYEFGGVVYPSRIWDMQILTGRDQVPAISSD